MLMRFPTPWGRTARIGGAFLVLQAVEGAYPETHPVRITVSRVLDPWDPARVTWGRQPRLSPESGAAWAVTGPPRALRIDVTTIVQRWQRPDHEEYGIALLANPDDVASTSYATGTGGGVGPRLDVYLR
jgi:hypothetical protein